MWKLALKIAAALAVVVAAIQVWMWFARLDVNVSVSNDAYAFSVRDGAVVLQSLDAESGWTWGGSAVAFSIALFLAFVALWFAIYTMRHGFGGLMRLGSFFRQRQEARGMQALSNAMIALEEGDGRTAFREAQRAERKLGGSDLTNLVNARAARLFGDERRAEAYFEALAQDPDTSFIGVRGLLGQAMAQEKPERALKLAERAHGLRPRDHDTIATLFALQRKKGDWSGARGTLEASVKAQQITRDVGERRRAVLHLAAAEGHEAAGDPKAALGEAIAALKLSPGLSQAAALAARLYAARGQLREASRALISAWRVAPHPQVAEAYAALAPDETPKARLKRFERLFAARPDDLESRLLKTELGLAADDLTTARRALGDLPTTDPSARACALRAAIAQLEGAPETEVRAWLAKAASAPRHEQWVCDACAATTPTWSSSCPSCGAFDSLGWRPIAALDDAGDVAMTPLLTVRNGPSLADELTAPNRLNGAVAPAQANGAVRRPQPQPEPPQHLQPQLQAPRAQDPRTHEPRANGVAAPKPQPPRPSPPIPRPPVPRLPGRATANAPSTQPGDAQEPRLRVDRTIDGIADEAGSGGGGPLRGRR